MEENKEKSEKKRICKTCGQEYVVKSGWKLLFKKPSFEDYITLFIIAMVIFSYWAYDRDMKTCRDTMNNLPSICTEWTTSNANMRNSSESYWKKIGSMENFSIKMIASPDSPSIKIIAGEKST